MHVSHFQHLKKIFHLQDVSHKVSLEVDFIMTRLALFETISPCFDFCRSLLLILLDRYFAHDVVSEGEMKMYVKLVPPLYFQERI